MTLAVGECKGDLNGDLKTNGADLSILLRGYGESVEPPPPDPHEAEFEEWLVEMGFEPVPYDPCILNTRGDLNCDNKIDGQDLAIVLSNFQCSEID